MSLERGARPLTKCLRCSRHDRMTLPIRTFSTTSFKNEEQIIEPASTSAAPPPPPNEQRYDPFKVPSARMERKLLATQRQVPVGSRRRRAALQTAAKIPFQQLPYQCFQEARKILIADREEKVEHINLQRGRIERLQAREVEPQNEAQKEHRLKSMRLKLEQTKILADINDPLVKKNFEDGQGDMNKPIYRHLAEQKWRSYKRKVMMQRITQMKIVPDVLPAIDPSVDTDLYFPLRADFLKIKKIPHGEIVPSTLSETAPNIVIQPFDKGDRLVTIAVINPDVPAVEKDGFEYRCHFLASNIRISPTDTLVKLRELDLNTQVVLPWLPPYSQKGIAYQRMSVIILEQPAVASTESSPLATNTTSQVLDVQAIKEAGRYTVRENFIMRSYLDKYRLKPVGVDLFRTQWDEGTAGVMQRAGIVGWDVEFLRKRVEPLPYSRLKAERYR